jgi:hypothetical protein
MTQEVIFAFVLILLILIILIFFIFFTFNRRRLKFIIEKVQIQRQTEKAVEEARFEGQEHMLKNISWELHDNIAQVIAVSKMQLSMLKESKDTTEIRLIKDTIVQLGKALEDIRSLSKSINNQSFRFHGLHESIEQEVSRLNRLKFINAEFSVSGSVVEINEMHALILYRIIQQVISNVIKHAKARHFQILFVYSPNNLSITLQDDGVGMKISPKTDGQGLKNIEARCKLLNAKIDIETTPQNGFKTKIDYPTETNYISQS